MGGIPDVESSAGAVIARQEEESGVGGEVLLLLRGILVQSQASVTSTGSRCP